MQPPTDEKRLQRVKRYAREEPELVRVLPKVLSTKPRARSELHKDLERRGFYGYTPAALGRRLKDLGYSMSKHKEPRTRRDYQGAYRHPYSYIFAPHWETGELEWLKPFMAAWAHDAPRPTPQIKMTMGARIIKKFNDLVASEIPTPDLENIRS